ncbi:GerAB/ArcD/ProY family transporter [Paenibacillus mucilaginosus]|uniref:Spore germination protein n=1 Tax=Paenibacillus mucilaginosus (strain KNP414) TaxID=1036673 RepID=F8FQK5_PAEMK|nr:GerAB/ArcD/ProY family transporter [Paenibacillus mucilaginosus]AEI40360.1 spore germination protein [Paenibacillus mucilaginosus KNP414]MCG7213283.1 spore germination protein [Paenibacillus mucilaginosus]WDM29560.1 GerAB/ArcD/ProY family transporter [Paenibacillus mucilaginosus]
MIHLKEISIKQLICLVIFTQVGAKVLTIPYEESRNSGYDSWMSVLLGGVIAQLVILIVYLLGKRYEDRPFPQYVTEITGKPLGLLLNVLFALYFIESSLMVLVTYANFINRWVLFKTPWFVIIALMAATAAYIASSSLRSIAVITETCILMFTICFVIVCISGLGKGDWLHFAPVGSHGLGPIIKDAIPAFWAYAGYERLLYFSPFVKRHSNKEILIGMSIANGFTTFFYVLISAIVLYNFSEPQLDLVTEPMVFILRQFKWPMVQNLDILFMVIWLSMTLVTICVYLFMSARFLASTLGRKLGNHALLVWILAFVCFAIGVWFSDRQTLLEFADYHNKASTLIIAGVPTILLLVSLARGKAGIR